MSDEVYEELSLQSASFMYFANFDEGAQIELEMHINCQIAYD